MNSLVRTKLPDGTYIDYNGYEIIFEVIDHMSVDKVDLNEITFKLYFDSYFSMFPKHLFDVMLNRLNINKWSNIAVACLDILTNKEIGFLTNPSELDFLISQTNNKTIVYDKTLQ